MWSFSSTTLLTHRLSVSALSVTKKWCTEFSVLEFRSSTHFNVDYWYKSTNYLLTYLLTYLFTPWSRVLLEKLTGSAASQEIPRIFGTRKFITILTSARHLSLSWANSIQSPQPPPTSWRSTLILSSHPRLGLPNGLNQLITLLKLQRFIFNLAKE